MKKRTLAMLICIVLAATVSLGTTLAYLTSEDGAVNVMTVGRVEIVQNEQDSEGNDFEQGQMLMPIVGGTSEKDENGYVTNPNYIDKIVTVTNTGNTDAWVRTLIAVPTYAYEGQDGENASNNVLHWNGYGEGHEATRQAAGQIPGSLEQVENHWYWGQEGAGAWPGNYGSWNKVEDVEINGQAYTVYVVTHTTTVESGATTAPNLMGLYLDSNVDYDHEAGAYTYDGAAIEGLTGDVEILVLSQAVQAAGFDTAWEAFSSAFDEGEAAPSVELLEEWLGDVYENGYPNLEVPTLPETGWLEDGEADTAWFDASKSTFTLTTAEELAGFAQLVNEGTNFSGKTVKLGADIDLGDHKWTPIGQTGTSYGAVGYFKGSFDGQGHTISNLYVLDTNEGEHYAAGLFGFLDCGQTGVIGNFTIDGAVINGHHWTGAAAGYLSGTLENVTVKNAEISCTHANDNACGDKAGAVVGYVNGTQGKIVSCSASSCTVTAGRDAGQVVGCAPASQVTGCTATNVTVTATGDCTGKNIKEDIIGRLN